MYKIANKVDFYITNVCNLTCDRCNRFNNHDFKGWQRWADYQEKYEKWGQLIDLTAVTIMGGEPFLNPTLKDWITGLNRIFDVDVQILTNGSRFRYSKDIYNSLLYRSTKTQAINHIGVSLHNLNDWEVMRQDIYNFLEAPIQELPKEKNLWGADWHFIDRNGVQINVYIVNNFGPAAIKTNALNRFTLHNSNPLEAHNHCAFVQFKSYHFIRGNLYKCGPVALMPEFDQQHTFDISDEDRTILNAYKSLTVDNFAEYSTEFLENIDNPIVQCKFCPVEHKTQPIYPLRKGLVSN